MPAKVASMRDAIAELVRDGDTVAIEGFTHLIGFSAGHEIIRQRRRDLTLARMTPDVIYDQMIAAGVARKLDLLVARQPGRRRAQRDPAADRARGGRRPGRLAGARGRGVQPLRHGRPVHRRRREPAVHAAALVLRDGPAEGQPADPRDPLALLATRRSTPSRRSTRTSRSSTPSAPTPSGNTQVWGLLGCQKEAAFAADRVIVVVEELVDEAVIRADPNRTIIPGLIVDAVVVDPFGAHPSYVQGAYDRDNRFYLDWDPISRDEDALQAWLREWVYDLDGRAAYVEKLGAERRRVAQARAARRPGSVDYGRYAMSRRSALLEVRDDDRRGRARARRAARLLRRRRAAEHRGQPRQADRRPGPRARLRGRRVRRAAGAAAAVHRRPDDRHRRDRRGRRCSSCSRSTCSAA